MQLNRVPLLCTILLLSSAPLNSQGWQQWRPAKSLWVPITSPPFARYAAQDTFAGTPAAVNLRSNPRASLYRTNLREGAKVGPNFAGHFTLLMWGCGGTDCATLAIIDARTGRVYFAPFYVYAEVSYQRTSRLLVVDPFTSWMTEADRAGPRFQYQYLWDGERLVLHDSVTMRPLPQR